MMDCILNSNEYTSNTECFFLDSHSHHVDNLLLSARGWVCFRFAPTLELHRDSVLSSSHRGVKYIRPSGDVASERDIR